MRRIPGVPELLGPGFRQPITDGIAIYRGRHAGASSLDFARLFADRGYRWRSFSVPDSTNRLVAARGSFEDEISLGPGAFLVSISSASAQAAGFRFSLTDVGRHESMSSAYFHNAAASGEPGFRAGRGSPFFLPAPWVVSAGRVLVQVVNLATVANTVDLYLQFAEPV